MSPTTSPRSGPTTETPPRRELRGVVERITFQNPENGFTVARLAPERRDSEAVSSMDDERLITLVGTLLDLQPGEVIVAHGWWRNDAKHGWQFQAAEYRTTLPATVQGMERYLGSGLVKGIGPVNAGRIVDAFGETTFSVIDETPDRSARRTSPRARLNEAAVSLATSERFCCMARFLQALLARATNRAEAQTLRSGPGLLRG